LKGDKWLLLGPKTVKTTMVLRCDMHKVCMWTVAVGRYKEESGTPCVISGFHCGINKIFAA